MRRCSVCLLVSSLLAAWAEPCDIVCVRAAGADLLASRYVLLGRVIDATWSEGEGTFTLEPVRVWKGGWPGDKTRFHATTYGSSCGYPLVKGAYYLLYADEEPQGIGLCHHQPVPLSEAAEDVASLDRVRHLPPTVVPDEAMLSPSEWRCPPSPADAQLDDKVGKSELIVVGRIVAVDSVSHADGHTTGTGRMEIARSIKGHVGRSVPVRFQYQSYINVTPTDQGIWFLGEKLSDGRRIVNSWRWDLQSEASIRSRVKRWRLLGDRACASDMQ